MTVRTHLNRASRARRGLVAALAGGLALAGLTAVGHAPASAAPPTLPPQCSVSGALVTCTYLKSGGSQILNVPTGVNSVSLRVVGQAGADSPISSGGTGGRAMAVTGTRSITNNQDLSIQFRNDGGAGGDTGGAGGGSTRVQLIALLGPTQTVAWAAGGGGGGAPSPIGYCGPGSRCPGGAGGDAGLPGADGSSAFFDSGRGGGPGAAFTGGAGGAGGTALGGFSGPHGISGASGAGGDGGGSDGGSDGDGGGGGGGVFGGGGGGAGAYNFAGNAASGGGGGGSSLAPSGGSMSLAAKSETARVVVTFSLPTGSISPTNATFAATDVDTQSAGKVFTVTNTSNVSTLVLGAAGFTGAHPGDFTTTADACSNTSIAPGATCTVTVAFEPTAVGNRSATLLIPTNTMAGVLTAALSGTGLPTGEFHIRGPGSAYAEGHGNRQTLTIGTSTSATAKFYLKIFNTTSTDLPYRISSDSTGAAANVKLTLSSNSVDLPRDANGHWVTPTIPAGGSKILIFRVDPTAPGQVTAKHTVQLRSAGGAVIDRALFETNIQAPTKGTDGYGLYAKASGPFVGGDVNGQTATQVPANTGQSRLFTIKLRNDSTTARSMLVKMAAAANACWTLVVKKGSVDLTGAFSSGGYTTPSIGPGRYLNLAVTVRRVASGCGAAYWEFSTWDGATKKHHSTILANALATTE